MTNPATTHSTASIPDATHPTDSTPDTTQALCAALAKETRAHRATQAKLAAVEAELAKTKRHLAAAKFGREKTTKQYKYLFKLIRTRVATNHYLVDPDAFEAFEKPGGNEGRVTLHKDYPCTSSDLLEGKVLAQFEEAIQDGLAASLGVKRPRIDTSVAEDPDL